MKLVIIYTLLLNFLFALDEELLCPVTGNNILKSHTTIKTTLKSNNAPRTYNSLTAFIVDNQKYGLNIDNSFMKVINKEKYISLTSCKFVLDPKVQNHLYAPSALCFDSEEKALKLYSKDKIYTFIEILKLKKEQLKSTLAKSYKINKKRDFVIGKNIYQEVCQEIDLEFYLELNELKADIVNSKLCQDLKEKDLDYLVKFLWAKKENKLFQGRFSIDVTENDKCPVCGMYVYKYPKWAATIKTQDHSHYFDGIKDLLKFYFQPKRYSNDPHNFTNALLLGREYYSGEPLDLTKAFFVIHSDVYGPMGHELLAFETLENAENFKKDHSGKILEFHQISQELVWSLDTYE